MSVPRFPGPLIGCRAQSTSYSGTALGLGARMRSGTAEQIWVRGSAGVPKSDLEVLEDLAISLAADIVVRRRPG